MRPAERYSRQLPLVGEEGQRRLRGTAVAVFGLGGLGALAARYIVGGGFGRVMLVDYDVVSVSDLHRQVLYTTDDVGRPKVSAAARLLRSVNPEVEVVEVNERVNVDLADRVLRDADMVIDALDNWESRLAVNAAAVRRGRVLVHGAAQEWYGHVTTVVPRRTPCLEELFGRAGRARRASGPRAVLGPAAGVVASLMALEAFNAALGAPRLAGRLLLADLKRMTFSVLDIARDPGCPVCGGAR